MRAVLLLSGLLSACVSPKALSPPASLVAEACFERREAGQRVGSERYRIYEDEARVWVNVVEVLESPLRSEFTAQLVLEKPELRPLELEASLRFLDRTSRVKAKIQGVELRFDAGSPKGRVLGFGAEDGLLLGDSLGVRAVQLPRWLKALAQKREISRRQVAVSPPGLSPHAVLEVIRDHGEVSGLRRVSWVHSAEAQLGLFLDAKGEIVRARLIRGKKRIDFIREPLSAVSPTSDSPAAP